MFGPFTFSRDSETLTRGGKHVPMGARSSALLRVLLDANGQVVSKTDLMESAWAGISVEEGNLTVQVAALRKTLGRRSDANLVCATFSRAALGDPETA